MNNDRTILQGETFAIGKDRYLCADCLDHAGKHYLFITSLDAENLCFAEQNGSQIRIINGGEEKQKLAALFQKHIGETVPLQKLERMDNDAE